MHPPKWVLYKSAAVAMAIACYLGNVPLGSAFALPQPESDELEAPPVSVWPITADQARSAALAHFPGATIQDVQRNNEDGVVVWGIQLTDSAGGGQDVKIDATTGQMLHFEPDGAQAEQQGGQGEVGE